MRRIIKESLEDRSSPERFQFSLRCAVCGLLWESQPVRFSKQGISLLVQQLAAAAAAGEKLDIDLQLIEGIHPQLSVEVAVVGLDGAGADPGQLRDVLDGVAVHVAACLWPR